MKPQPKKTRLRVILETVLIIVLAIVAAIVLGAEQWNL